MSRFLTKTTPPIKVAQTLLESRKRIVTKQAKDYLADGLFAYQNIVEICKKEIDELYEEGIKYFDLFLKFIFDIYQDIEKKEEKLLMMNEQAQSRYVELRQFVKSEIFDDFLVVFITRVGTQGVIDV